MTKPADARSVEAAFEAALSGRPVPADVQGLAAFTDAVRSGATAAGRPNAALAELLATGLIPDPSRTTVGRPARTSRKRTPMIVSTLVAKFAAAGAVAKAATAGGAVAIALTGAGAAAGVMPGQEEPPAVVESGTGLAPAEEPSDTETVLDEGGTEEATEEATEETTEEGTEEAVDEETPLVVVTEEEWLLGPVEGQSFSDWVSQGARQGHADGATISCYAQVRSGHRDASDCQPAAEQPATGGQTTQQPAADRPAPPRPTQAQGAGRPTTAPAPVPAPGPAPAPAPAPGGAVDGNGNGNGNGNGGNGNGGGNGSGRP